jgi:hypothetical protein
MTIPMCDDRSGNAASSPLRITRGADFQSLNTRGLYPAGEGAGYAGGILSAAVDGIRVAEALAVELVIRSEGGGLPRAPGILSVRVMAPIRAPESPRRIIFAPQAWVLKPAARIWRAEPVAPT